MTAYEESSLRLQFWGTLVQGAGLAATIGSVIFLGWQIKEQVKATNAQVEATRAQHLALDVTAYQDLMSKQLEADRILIDKPGLYPYLFGHLDHVGKKGVVA